MNAEIERHYSADEVAALLGVTKRTVWTYIERGHISNGRDGIYPVVKLSFKMVRIPGSAVNRFLKNRTVSVQSVTEEARA